MLIDKTSLRPMIYDALEKISMEELPIHSRECPHCGLMVRYPTVVREHDLRDFERLMEAAGVVMQEYGITGNLIADIIARCHISIANKSAAPDENAPSL